MKRIGTFAALVITLTSSVGCSICCTPYDYAYPAYGGKWERTDRFHGRVGSAFEPAGPIPASDANDIVQPTQEVPMSETEPMMLEEAPE